MPGPVGAILPAMLPLFTLLSLLFACPAEQLGVELPKGGAQSMSQEDLQRDLFMMVELPDRRPGGAGYAAGLERIAQRLDQMKTLPAFGDGVRRPAGEGENLCTRHDGQSGRAIVIAAIDAGNGADESASAIAALISLAKSFDVAQPPKHTMVFCVLPAQGGVEAYVQAPAFPVEKTVALLTLGPMGGPKLASEESVVGAGLRRVHLSTGPDAVHGTPDDNMGRLDFRVMLRNVERVLEAVDGLAA